MGVLAVQEGAQSAPVLAQAGWRLQESRAGVLPLPLVQETAFLLRFKRVAVPASVMHVARCCSSMASAAACCADLQHQAAVGPGNIGSGMRAISKVVWMQSRCYS